MTSVILGTGTSHAPTLDLAQPNGRYSWRWQHGADGLQLIDKPVRLVRGQPDPDGKTVDPPGWAQNIADVWSRKMSELHNNRSMNPNNLAARARDLESHYTSIAKAIAYDPPGLRQHAAKWAGELNRRALDHGTPLQESEMYINTAARVTDLLRRTQPRAAASGEGPTTETLAKHVPDPIEDILNGHILTDRQKEAAREARAIWRALTFRLDAKAGNMEAVGGGAGFKHPFEEIKPPLDEAYDKRYRPWSEVMGRRAWWYDPARRGMFEQAECRYAAKVTYLNIIAAVMFESGSFAHADERYRLPPGRSLIVVKVGLDDYGRVW